MDPGNVFLADAAATAALGRDLAARLSARRAPAILLLEGDLGAGKTCLVQGLAEAMAFGQKAGLDGAAVVEVISQGAAGSWQMVNRHKTMLEDKFDFGFAVDWMRKDLKICLETADVIGAQLPVTALVDQFYKDVQLMGGNRNDTSSLIRRLK